MEIKKYLSLIRHWIWLILLGAVVAGAAAFMFSNQKEPLYRSEAVYEVDVAGGSASNSEYIGQLVAKNLIQTNIQKIATTSIAALTIEELASKYPELLSWEPADLLTLVSISSPLDSLLIEIAVVDSNPTRASDLANTMGIVFARENTAQQRGQFTQSIELLDTRLSDIDEDLTRIRTSINEFGEAETSEQQIQLERLNRELEEARSSYNSVFESQLELELSMAGRIHDFLPIEPAQPNPVPISPRIRTNTVLATVVGLMLTLGIILLLDYMDDTVKTTDEAMKTTGASTLATIAYIKGDKASDRLITQVSPRAPVSEAYRVLRTNLSFSAIDRELSKVLVTSSAPGEGKSTTSANIAVVMAQTGRRVVLIDGDLRKPTQHKVFEASNSHGLTTALLDSSTQVVSHLQPTRTPGLRLMASGPLPPNPAELLGSRRMLDVMDELLKDADIIILDTPPVLTVADAAILANKVDGCILVAEVGQTRHDILGESAERLRSTGATLFGLVLNRSKAGRAGYYYAEKYSYEYGPTNLEDSPKRGIFGRLSNSSSSGD